MRYRELLLPLGLAALGFIAGVFTNPSRLDTEALLSRDVIVESEQHGPMPKGADEDDPLGMILGSFGEPDLFQQFATFGTWLDRLSTPEIHELLERLRRGRAEDRKRLLPAVLAHWSSRDPVAATEWIRPFLNDPSRVQSVASSSRFPNFDACLKSWAQSAPEHALAVAREDPKLDSSRTILGYAIYATNGSPAENLRTLAEFPANEQRHWLTLHVISSWAKENREAALAAAKVLPRGSERDASIAAILKMTASRNPAATLAEAEALGVENLPVLGGLLLKVASTDPATAITWLERRDPALETTLGQALMLGWAETDPIAALDWAWKRGAQGEAKTLDSRLQLLGRDPLRNAFVKNPDATINWLKQLPAGVERDELIRITAHATPKAASAIPLLSQLSGEAAAEVAKSIGSRLIYDDPVQAEQWAANLPSGPTRAAAWEGIGTGRVEPLPIPPGADRDAMLNGMALMVANRTEPHKAVEKALEIGEPSLRQRAFEDAMTLWVEGPSSGSSHAAAEWLQNAVVPVDWKKKWMDRLRP